MVLKKIKTDPAAVYAEKKEPEKLEELVTVSDAEGKEKGYAEDIEIDIDVADKKDFEIQTSVSLWENGFLGFGNRIYIPGTEYGGIIGDLEVATDKNQAVIRGRSWRGVLAQKIVEPPSGEDNLILSGDISAIIKQIVGDKFGKLFIYDEEETGIQIKKYVVARYVSVYDAIIKLLEQNEMKLLIAYDKTEKAAILKAEPVVDYSDKIEYSQDSDINFTVRDYRMGVNHLICGGQGEGKDRQIAHLYVQEDGNIGTTQFYSGMEEVSEFYDYANAESLEKLVEDGTERLKSLQNYKKMEMEVDNADMEIGDVVGGRERITGIELRKPIVNKIFKIKSGKTDIEYKVKGED